MDNEHAREQMLSAITHKVQERVAQLEQEYIKEQQRLEEESSLKILELSKQLNSEFITTEEKLRIEMKSRLNMRKKDLNLEQNHHIMSQILNETYEKLFNLTQTPSYRDRLLLWIKECIQVVLSDSIFVRLGSADLLYWDDSLISEIKQFSTDKLGLNMNIDLNPNGVHAGVGPIVVTKDGKRMCDNTLSSRFSREKVALSRMAAQALIKG